MTQRTGPHTSGQANPTEALKVHAGHNLDAIPIALHDVALIDGPTCAAAGGMSISQWSELVRTGNAPPPVIRQPRFTRWRLADIRAWLIERAEKGGKGDAAARVTAQATKASRAASAKRASRAEEDDDSSPAPKRAALAAEESAR
jgi:predicted DNA-binding transcriptional regulator AlpA